MKKFGIAMLSLLTLCGGYAVYAQDSSSSGYFPIMTQAPKAPAMEMCKQMMGDQEDMKMTMASMDTKMDDMVKAMQFMTGEAKTNAMGDILAAMVKERHSLRTMHETMDGKMRMHMMQHMKSGKMDCPMMGKGMMGKGTMGGG